MFHAPIFQTKTFTSHTNFFQTCKANSIFVFRTLIHNCVFTQVFIENITYLGFQIEHTILFTQKERLKKIL